MTLLQLDKKQYGREGEPEDVVVGNSTGSYLTDARGYASNIGDTCRESSLLISAEEDVLMPFAALNISRATAVRGLDIFEMSLS
jgi:hypothetical protein